MGQDGKKEGRNKADDKAIMAAKRENKAHEMSLGINSVVKKSMAGDVLICTVCKATEKGPVFKCTCVGGKTKPGPGYDPLSDLAEAAKARAAASTADVRAAQTAGQAGVAAAKAKKRAGEMDLGDLAAEGLLQGDNDGISMMSLATFTLGKLGMDLEKSSVCKVGDASTQANEQGVKVGWVLRSIAGTPVASGGKAAILKQAAVALKATPVGVRFEFQMSIDDAVSRHCAACDKFFAIGEFSSAQLAAGPGKQMCGSCEEYAETYGDGGDMYE